MDPYPVLEVAILNIKQGQAAFFLEAFSVAEPIIVAAEGYGGHERRRCAENDHRFLLLVWWDSVRSHEIGFRQSAAYEQWRRLLHRFMTRSQWSSTTCQSGEVMVVPNKPERPTRAKPIDQREPSRGGPRA